MNSLLWTLGVAIAVTIFCEGILWLLFRLKMKPLSFPHELDTSYFRFFSMARLRIATIVHAICTVISVTLFLIYLW